MLIAEDLDPAITDRRGALLGVALEELSGAAGAVVEAAPADEGAGGDAAAAARARLSRPPR
jgi:hypothetical protein